MPAEPGARRLLLATAVSHYSADPALNRPELVQARDQVVRLFTERLGYELDHTLGTNPTEPVLTGALRRFSTDPGRRAEDLVVLYVAAHGEVVESTGEHRLLTSECRSDDIADAMPTLRLAQKLLLETPVRRLLLLLDTCYSGRGGNEVVASALKQMGQGWTEAGSGFAVISSAQPHEQAESGAFPRLLERAVEASAAEGGTGALDLDRLVQHMNDDPERPGYQQINLSLGALTGRVPPFVAIPPAGRPGAALQDRASEHRPPEGLPSGSGAAGVLPPQVRSQPSGVPTPLGVARRSGHGPLFPDADPPRLDGDDGLDGEQRRKAALTLWERWTKQRRSAALLYGFPGVGKTDRVVRPLLDEARLLHDRVTVLVDAPEHPVNASKELLARLHAQLDLQGHYGPASAIASERRLDKALVILLNLGVLVVVDEFQRLLGPDGRPVQPVADDLKAASGPGARGDGCLWLVSSQKVHPVWAQAFHPVELPPPPVEDAVRILLSRKDPYDAEQWFPEQRRVEVVERLGRNPFALSLLDSLVGPSDYSLEEVLGPPSAVPQAPYDLQLVDLVEKELVTKATERLTAEAAGALRQLSVLTDWAGQDLVEAMTGHLGHFPAARKQLQERFLLQVRSVSNETTHARSTRYQVHPAVREIVCVRMRHDAKSWSAAHRRAGLWHARPLFARDPSRAGELRLALALSAARLHFVEGQLPGELARAVQALGRYMEREFGKERLKLPPPSSPAEVTARIQLLDAYHTEDGTPFTHHHLARLLRHRAEPGDLERALEHARPATRGQSDVYPWSLLLKLLRDVRGPEAAVQAGWDAIEHIKDGRAFVVYDEIAKCQIRLGRAADALETLREGCARVKRQDAYRLAEHAVQYAAAEPTAGPLEETAAWVREDPALRAQAYMAEVLLLQRHGKWPDSARMAQSRRREYATFIHLAVYEALGWLGAGDPARAQQALTSFPGGVPNSPRPKPREGKTWLASLIALHDGDLDRARRMLALYLGVDEWGGTAEELRRALLAEWDRPETRMDESNPAFVAPVLPPYVTGRLSLAVRSQYGSPVLTETAPLS
ncbi:caspase family protein [Streptomyces sp. NPDC050803]|uniref:caspase family protein n=1 Tax=unclassified Streptomyces TaxID=2593676 RepID=UPI003448F400